MSSIKDFYWRPERTHPLRQAARSLLAALLGSASAWLARFALDLAAPRPVAPTSVDPRFEYHAEAGAPEGALYVDGQLIGHLPGVHRL